MHMRMAPAQAAARRLRLTALACALAAAACRPAVPADVTFDLVFDPAPPATGVDTIVRVTLQDGQGRPLRGADLKLEGHMSHPGMVPLTAQLRERPDGAYEGRLRFSMGGGWVIVVTGDLPDGHRITRYVDVPGVVSP
jgi:hypothetical protein